MGNRIGNVSQSGANGLGIYLDGSTELIVSDNLLSGMSLGIYWGIATTGKYFSNVTQGVTVPYSGVTAAGATNY